MNNAKVLLGLAASVSLSACVTGLDTVQMTSQPSEAKVVFEDMSQDLQPQTCATPCEIKLSETRTYKTTVSKAGYEDFTMVIEPKVKTSERKFFIAGTPGGTISGPQSGVEKLTTEYLSPNNLDVILSPAGGASYAVDDGEKKIESLKSAMVSE